MATCINGSRFCARCFGLNESVKGWRSKLPLDNGVQAHWTPFVQRY